MSSLSLRGVTEPVSSVTPIDPNDQWRAINLTSPLNRLSGVQLSVHLSVGYGESWRVACFFWTDHLHSSLITAHTSETLSHHNHVLP